MNKIVTCFSNINGQLIRKQSRMVNYIKSVVHHKPLRRQNRKMRNRDQLSFAYPSAIFHHQQLIKLISHPPYSLDYSITNNLIPDPEENSEIRHRSVLIIMENGFLHIY